MRLIDLLRPKRRSHVTILPCMDAGKGTSRVRWHGLLHVDPRELRAALKNGWAQTVEGWNLYADPEVGSVLCLPKPNLVVDVGVQRGLDLIGNINAISLISQTIGVDNGTTNPVAASVSSTAGGGSDTGSTSRRIVAVSPTATRAGNVLSSSGAFTQANVAFAMKRLFLSKAAAGTTDASGDLYAMTNVFTMDLTSFSSWSQTFTAQVTGVGA